MYQVPLSIHDKQDHTLLIFISIVPFWTDKSFPMVIVSDQYRM